LSERRIAQDNKQQRRINGWASLGRTAGVIWSNNRANLDRVRLEANQYACIDPDQLGAASNFSFDRWSDETAPFTRCGFSKEPTTMSRFPTSGWVDAVEKCRGVAGFAIGGLSSAYS